MAVSLASLRHGGDLKPPIIVIFGPGGVGKTTLAAGAPDPVFIWTERGSGRLDVPGWEVSSFAEVIDASSSLYSEEHSFKTVVIDSLDWLEPLIWAEACQRHGWKSVEDPGYGRGYVAALGIWREYLEALNALRDDKGMTIVELAHYVIKRFDAPDNEPYDRYLIKLHERAGGLVQEHADVVAFANYRVSIAKADAGFGKKVARAVGGGQRVLYLEERPAFHAKNRLGLPASIDLPNITDAWQHPEKIWAVLAEHLPETEPTKRDAGTTPTPIKRGARTHV